MDIIQQLPFPDEICHKIVLYAFKSPHTHLQEEIFKRAVPTHIYQKLVEKGGIKTDAHGHITNVCVENDAMNNWLLDAAERKSLQFDIQVLPRVLQNLTTIQPLRHGCLWGHSSPARASTLDRIRPRRHGRHGGHSSPPRASTLDRILPRRLGCQGGHSSPPRASKLNLLQPTKYGCQGGHSSPPRASTLDRTLPHRRGCQGGQESVS